MSSKVSDQHILQYGDTVEQFMDALLPCSEDLQVLRNISDMSDVFSTYTPAGSESKYENLVRVSPGYSHLHI